MRVGWAVQALLLAPAISQALDDRSRPVQLVGMVGGWSVWFVGLLATLLPGPIGLTVVRMILPGAIGAAGTAWLGGSSSAAGLVAVTAALVVTIVGFSGDAGQAFVRASAYGDEARLLLRPPGPLLIGPIPALEAITVAAVIAGPLLLAARSWWWGAIVTAVAIGLIVLAGPRFHVLSCRWLVFVPAGVVVHDPLVLAETVMFRGTEVDSMGLAEAGTEAADLTGQALGTAVEVRLAGTGTVVLAPTGRDRQGSALHVRSFLVAPTRPGRTLSEARSRGIAG